MDDRFVHRVAADPYRAADDDAGQRDDRDVGGAAADVDDHVAGRVGDRQTRADGGRHRLVDEVHLAGLGAIGGVLHGAPLDRRDLGGHADEHPGPEPGANQLVGLADEVREHLLGGVEVGNHPVLDRPDGTKMAGTASEHLPGGAAHRLDNAAHGVEGNEGGLVQDDAASFGVDAGIGGAEIDSEIGSEVRQGHGDAAPIGKEHSRCDLMSQ